MYNNFFLKIDEIVEWILILGYVFNYKFFDYLKFLSIKEINEVNDGFKVVGNILSFL